jgi:3-dehydroquinate dehydratase I
MSKPISVRGVVIGDGTPKICVPIMGNDSSAILHSLSAALAVQPDILEWRVDYLADCSPANAAAVLADIRAAAGETPLLATFRTRHEGGKQAITGREYAALLATLVNSGMIDLLDMELAMLTKTAQVKGVRELAKQKGIPVIYSSHNFQQTAPKESLVKILKAMVRLDCDIAKLAVMPQTSGDVLTLLAATDEMKRLNPDQPIITMSMGQLGMISRLSGGAFGSAITFGSAESASAPGQIPALQLREMLNVLQNSTNSSQS